MHGINDMVGRFQVIYLGALFPHSYSLMLSGKLCNGRKLLSIEGYFVRTFIAFLVAPLLPAVLPTWYLAQSPNKSGPSAYIFVSCLIYFGVPAFLFFRRTHHRLWPYLLGVPHNYR